MHSARHTPEACRTASAEQSEYGRKYSCPLEYEKYREELFSSPSPPFPGQGILLLTISAPAPGLQFAAFTPPRTLCRTCPACLYALRTPGTALRPPVERPHCKYIAAAPFSRRSLALLDSRSMYKTAMLSGSVADSALQRHMAAKGHQEQCFPSRGAKEDERAI